MFIYPERRVHVDFRVFVKLDPIISVDFFHRGEPWAGIIQRRRKFGSSAFHFRPFALTYRMGHLRYEKNRNTQKHDMIQTRD